MLIISLFIVNINILLSQSIHRLQQHTILLENYEVYELTGKVYELTVSGFVILI